MNAATQFPRRALRSSGGSMITKTFANVAIVVLTVGGLAACGNSSNTEANNAKAAQPVQNCAQDSASKPGYPLPINKLDGGATTLSGAGSTFVAPAMSVWTKDYNTSDGVTVAYQSVGSGEGVQQINSATVDFGASDTPMLDSELASSKGGPILHIPLVLGAVVPAYNVKDLDTGLKFDGETLGKIFAGKITKWNDAALQALNPGTNLPDEPIAVAHRSDGSGTTAVWTDYLTKESPTWVSTLGGSAKSFGKEVAWPVGTGGNGNEGVSGVINQTEGGIGYVELDYAIEQYLKYGQVKNKAGNFIQPGNFVHACIATITKGTEGITYPEDLRTSLTDSSNPGAYPITGTTYALVYANQTDPAKGKALVNFFSWVLSKGQDEVANLSYAPLGKDLQQKSVDQLKKIMINGAPAG